MAIHGGRKARSGNAVVFDLDPGEGVTMPQLCEVANAVRDLMDDIGLVVYPLTSGSSKVCISTRHSAIQSAAKSAVVLAWRVAQQLEQSIPKLVTATMTKSLRAGKVFPGLEPEQRVQDHDRAVLAARTGASDGRRALDLGRDR